MFLGAGVAWNKNKSASQADVSGFEALPVGASSVSENNWKEARDRVAARGELAAGHKVRAVENWLADW